LHLQVSNTIDENRQLQQTGGIGLQNLKKRLNLYYPEKHEYHYQLTVKDYTATVTLEL
jgi:sensor histidine kinase YesM